MSEDQSRSLKVHGVLFLATAAVLVIGCSTTNTKNKFGHYHDYPYKPPAFVSAENEDKCSWIANSKAQEAVSKIDERELTTASFFGALGVSIGMMRWDHIMNDAYEEAMKSCLRNQGYEISD